MSNKPKKQHYITDTAAGIRRIDEIRKLPSCQLTDEEFVKEFFDRFNAKALIMVYVDEQGQSVGFGRLKKGAKPFEYYRMLSNKMDALFDVKSCKEIDANNG